MSSTTAYMLYMVFTLGGAAIYFGLPRTDRSTQRIGTVFGASALAALVVVLARYVVSSETTPIYFYLFAIIAIGGGARMITHPKPVYSAIYFVLVVVAVAAMLVLQNAEFLAVALIIIYAGAILVTYLFVIMLANQGGTPTYDRNSREPFMAVLGGFVLMAAIVGKTCDLPAPRASSVSQVRFDTPTMESSATSSNNTALIGAAVMTKYVVVLEISGVLLLISMIGAISLSRKKVVSDTPEAPEKPLGQIGKEVAPY